MTENHPEAPLTEALAALAGTPVLPGNSVDILVNGDRIFPAMLSAINESTREICFETFIYWSGDIAAKVAAALARAAARGVQVSVILDWWGAQRMDDGLADTMESAGVVLRYFNPLRWSRWRHANHRDHRKLLVVDRQLAFTGGVGIAEEWCGDARTPDEWHDLHYRFRGPVVAAFHTAFEVMWVEIGGGTDDTPRPGLPGADAAEVGSVCTQLLISSPRRNSDRVYDVFQYAIRRARRSIRIMIAYFVPDAESINALVEAARRGVEVQIMIPGHRNDRQSVRYASRSSWGALLSAGVALYIYQPTMLHAKVVMIDDDWVIVGSANFDNRSFALNDEIVVNIINAEFAGQQVDLWHGDLERCRRVSIEEWRNRGLVAIARERLANLVRWLL